MAHESSPSIAVTTAVSSNHIVYLHPEIIVDFYYFRAVPGILNIVQVLLGFVGFICVQLSNSYHSRGSFFSFVACGGIWFSASILIFYICHLIEKFHKIPWLKIEFGFYSVWGLLYLIAGCLAANHPFDGYSAAAFFGFGAMVAYAVHATFKFQAIQNGEPAQGDRLIIDS